MHSKVTVGSMTALGGGTSRTRGQEFCVVLHSLTFFKDLGFIIYGIMGDSKARDGLGKIDCRWLRVAWFACCMLHHVGFKV